MSKSFNQAKTMVSGLVTVIVPAYNHELYIAQALDSVLLQDYPEIELLVIDDGSSDQTASVVDQWIERNSNKVSVKFRSRPNRGVSATMNELLEWARGEFIAGLSSDDYLLEKSISSRIQYLRENPAKKAVFGKIIAVNGAGEITSSDAITDVFKGQIESFSYDAGIRREILTNFCVAGPALLCSREAMDIVGNYNEGFIIEDWDLYMRLSGHDFLGFLDVAVAAYRLHGANASQQLPKNYAACKYQRQVLMKNRDIYKGDDLQIIDEMIKVRRKKERSFLIEQPIKKFLSLIGLRKKTKKFKLDH